MPQYEDLVATIRQTGIWDGARAQSHCFVVSPNVYQLSAADNETLTKLARAVDACLLGVSRLMAIAADSSLTGNSKPYHNMVRLLSRGGFYGLNGADTRPGNLPLLRKVDIVPGTNGHLWIAEIDATNPRSLGYSLIGRNICQVIEPQGSMLGGVVPFVVDALQRRGVSEITFLYGHTQRFYEPEFRILAKALGAQGITMTVVNEIDIEIVDDWPKFKGRRLPGWFVDLPSMNQNKQLIDWLVNATRQRKVEFLVPPKYFLSSKALLAVLSNAGGNPGLEHLLLSQITPENLDVVRRHIPPTVVVDKSTSAGEVGVLKKLMASGAKGVWFPDDPAYEPTLERARREPGTYVLQQEVSPGAFAWQRFAPSGDAMPAEDWFLRLTAYLSHRGVEDIAVTACRDKVVHGGPNAILTGTILA